MLPLTMYCTFCCFVHFVCDQIPAQTTLCQSNSNWHESVKPSESLVIIIMHSLKALTYMALRKSVLSFCHGKLDGLRAKHLSLHRLKRFSMQANQTTTHTTLTKDIINKHTPVNLPKMTKSKWQTVVVKKLTDKQLRELMTHLLKQKYSNPRLKTNTQSYTNAPFMGKYPYKSKWVQLY